MSLIYTCPMHPSIQSPNPEACSICGMALETIGITHPVKENSEYIDFRHRFWISLLLSIPVISLSMASHLWPLETLFSKPFSYVIQWLFSTPVVLWGGLPFFQRAWFAIKSKTLNMFTLISLGVSVSYIYSVTSIFYHPSGDSSVYFEVSATIIVLVLLGQLLELKARDRTHQAVNDLLDLTPETAHRVTVSGDETILVDSIHPEDILRIKPGEKIPVDGIVIDGESPVNESMLTGEAMPISKSKGDPVIAGTINGNGVLLIRAKKVGENTVLANIIKLVMNAQQSQIPIQKLVDRISSIFVPSVILIAFITFVIWWILSPTGNTGLALMASISVLIIACPCALGLATPISMIVSIGRGARAGILIKNAEAIERLEQINTVLMDKTGTITSGQPTLTHILPERPFTREALLVFAATLEKNSEHPIATAIMQVAKEEKVNLNLAVKSINIRSGKGIIGTINGQQIALGNQALMADLNINVTSIEKQIRVLRKTGNTIVLVSIDKTFAGLLVVNDPIKPNISGIINALKSLKLNIVMLTGDNQITAETIAKLVNIDNVHAHLFPHDKYGLIESYQNSDGIVAMLGDGINDAPALVKADVGVAMGTGADIAIESADIVLLQGSLIKFLEALHLSRATMKNIRQNLFFAFLYNALGIPIAAGALYPWLGITLSPMIAAATMSLSSLSVVLNALRLTSVKFKDETCLEH